MAASFNEKEAHIVYASDDRFAEILGVSMVSLFENSKDMEEIYVYILDSGIVADNKKRIKYVCDKYSRAAPVWIKAKDISQELSMEVAMDRGSLSQYARLFVSSVLPAGLPRVLYLDCDTVIRHSIYELWRLDLQGKVIGALMDAFSRYYRKNIGLQPDDIMFNSGVMLIDLEKWKDKKVEEKLMKFIIMKNGKIQQGDQGVLNAVLSHDTYCFEPRFNSVTIFYDFTYNEMLLYRKPPGFYPEEDVERAAEDPCIVHFTTSFLSRRPWIKGCRHKFIGIWLEYKNKSPWKEKPLWENSLPPWKKMCLEIYNILPKYIALRIASFMQVYGRPLKYRFNTASIFHYLF